MFDGASETELHYLAGVLEILRDNDPVFAEGIRRAVDSYEFMKRKAARGNAHAKRGVR
ncbi:MAG: hypothetical protein ACM3S5_18830 [Rhodospirillales bacterium]|jgi:hypothetical protein